MKKVILKEKVCDLYLSDLKNNSHVGFIDSYGGKGYVAYVGGHLPQLEFAAISTQIPSHSDDVPNKSYGPTPNKPSLREALEIEQHCSAKIVELFVFENRKQLYKWLSE